MSKAVPIDAPRITVEKVTPAMAAQLLGTMSGNRQLRMRMVNRYAREMIAGKWQLNGESIKVSHQGKLIDGQHRLNAVIQSGVSVQMVVIRGVDAAAFLTLDTGVSRNYHDATTIAGRDWLPEAGSIARWWMKYERGVTTTAAKVAPSHQEMDDMIARHPGIPESARFIKSLRVVQNRCGAGVQGFVHAFASEKYDREMADSFMQDLNDGASLVKGSPIYALRQRLIDYSERKPLAEHVLAITIKVWNAWMNGETMQTVVWRTGGERPEPFPQFTVDKSVTGESARQARRAANQRARRIEGDE